MGNIYFDLTREFNAGEIIALLTSGPAVVFYRITIMSKDGDWILRETPEACRRVLDVLATRGARYRFGSGLFTPYAGGDFDVSLLLPSTGGALAPRTDLLGLAANAGVDLQLGQQLTLGPQLRLELLGFVTEAVRPTASAALVGTWRFGGPPAPSEPPRPDAPRGGDST